PVRHRRIFFPVSLTSGFCQDLMSGFLGGETQGRASALHAISRKSAHRIGRRIEQTTRGLAILVARLICQKSQSNFSTLPLLCQNEITRRNEYCQVGRNEWQD